MAIATPEQPRDRRFQLRATASEETLIKVAAEQQGVNVTDFIIRAARDKAEESLAAQTRFVLDERRWKLFMEALDRPAGAATDGAEIREHTCAFSAWALSRECGERVFVLSFRARLERARRTLAAGQGRRRRDPSLYWPPRADRGPAGVSPVAQEPDRSTDPHQVEGG